MNRPVFGGPARAGDDCRTKVVEFSERDLAEAKRLLEKIVIESGGNESVAERIFADSHGRAHLLERAAAVLENRQRRAKVFHRGMFGEPAWEMLLALYVRHDGKCDSIEGLRLIADVTLTTALRWLDYLERDKLVRRLEHRFDKRRVSIEITENGRELLDLYFSGAS